MEEYSHPDDILPMFYSLLFVISFLGFTTCCGYLLYKRAECEERKKHTRVYPNDFDI